MISKAMENIRDEQKQLYNSKYASDEYFNKYVSDEYFNEWLDSEEYKALRSRYVVLEIDMMDWTKLGQYENNPEFIKEYKLVLAEKHAQAEHHKAKNAFEQMLKDETGKLTEEQANEATKLSQLEKYLSSEAATGK